MIARSTAMPESLAARGEDPVSFSLTPKEVLVSTNWPDDDQHEEDDERAGR